jgi:phosphoenolpyruvate carboxykinase (ATP)
VEFIIRNDEGEISDNGAVLINTGQHTGRSPNDKFVVRDEVTENKIWWGKINQPLSIAHFERILSKVSAYLQ